MPVRSVLLVIAFVLFIIGALPVAIPRVNLSSLGLAFFAGAFLVP